MQIWYGRIENENFKNFDHTQQYYKNSNLDKLDLIWRFDYRLKQNCVTAPAAPKNIAHFKSSQKCS